jgi:hypothetical protein
MLFLILRERTEKKREKYLSGQLASEDIVNLICGSTLKMEATGYYRKFINIYETT